MLEDYENQVKLQFKRFKTLLAESSTNVLEATSTEGTEVDLSNGAICERLKSTSAALHLIVRNYLDDKEALHDIVRKIESEGDVALRILRDEDTHKVDRRILSTLEAIVRTDGSRPSFLIIGDRPDYKSSPAGEWKDKLGQYDEILGELFSCVCRINDRFAYHGTGTLVSHNLIMTNRHVLTNIVEWKDGQDNRPHIKDGVHVDFGYEFRGRQSINRRAVKSILYLPEGPFSPDMLENKLDLVLLQIDPIDIAGKPAKSLAVDVSNDWAGIEDILVIGYPGPPPERKYDESLIEQIFGKTYGHKRVAPGKKIVESKERESGWSTSHDATTLGGNSGSPVVALTSNQIKLVAGLHYGYKNNLNRCHILGKALSEPDRYTGKTLRECLEGGGVLLIDPFKLPSAYSSGRTEGGGPQTLLRQRRNRELPRCVCRIENRDNEPLGTGFLISHNLVMTCYHVVENYDFAKLQFRFDYTEEKALADTTPFIGSKLTYYSEIAAEDRVFQKVSMRDSPKLDYAILELFQSPGYDHVAGTIDHPVIRGWINFSRSPEPPILQSYLGIVQNPKISPRIFEDRQKSIEMISPEKTRFVHSNFANPGSSGSPCFDWDWNLIGIHQAGENKALHKQGISAKAIYNDLVNNQFDVPPEFENIFLNRLLVMEKPRCVDFRPRVLYADPDWKGMKWIDEAMMVTLLGVSIRVNAQSNRLYHLTRLRLAFPQFPFGKKKYLWGWYVNLNESGSGFMGHVADVREIDILPGETFNGDIMFKPAEEASSPDQYLTWSEFMDCIDHLSASELEIRISHEFAGGSLETSYRLAKSSIVANLIEGGKFNKLGVARFIQPSFL